MALAINTSRISPNRSVRRSKIRRIVIHHWDDPKRNPSLAGVVSWLTSTRSRVSAHYVVSERQVYRLVPESVVAWHAAGGNQDSIGIECDPRQQDSTYETVAELIRDIRSRHGDLPLVRHRAGLRHHRIRRRRVLPAATAAGLHQQAGQNHVQPLHRAS